MFPKIEASSQPASYYYLKFFLNILFYNNGFRNKYLPYFNVIYKFWALLYQI